MRLGHNRTLAGTGRLEGSIGNGPWVAFGERVGVFSGSLVAVKMGGGISMEMRGRHSLTF